MPTQNAVLHPCVQLVCMKMNFIILHHMLFQLIALLTNGISKWNPVTWRHATDSARINYINNSSPFFQVIIVLNGAAILLLLNFNSLLVCFAMLKVDNEIQNVININLQWISNRYSYNKFNKRLHESVKKKSTHRKHYDHDKPALSIEPLSWSSSPYISQQS